MNVCSEKFMLKKTLPIQYVLLFATPCALTLRLSLKFNTLTVSGIGPIDYRTVVAVGPTRSARQPMVFKTLRIRQRKHYLCQFMKCCTLSLISVVLQWHSLSHDILIQEVGKGHRSGGQFSYALSANSACLEQACRCKEAVQQMMEHMMEAP